MPKRITRAEANYRKGSPVECCGICAFYQGHNRCSQVMGDISPYGLSDVFRAEGNPFGRTITDQEKMQIRAMAAR
jgi:hypothetical protein